MLFVLDLAEISSRIMAENTTLIDLHLEMFRGSIISTCIKCDSFIYARALRGTLDALALGLMGMQRGELKEWNRVEIEGGLILTAAVALRLAGGRTI